MKYYIHPETKKAVDAEFSRLHLKNPKANNQVKVEIARRYVRALAIADTTAFMQSMEIADSLDQGDINGTL